MEYHPELAPRLIVVALQRQAEDFARSGLADTVDDVELRVSELDGLHDDPDRRLL